MKDTGVVRRIDDLGRIVIPKEIRKNLKIREGDSLEIYVNHDGAIMLNKYSPLGEMEMIAKTYAESVCKSNDIDIIITDMEKVIATNSRLEKSVIGNKIEDALEKIIEKKESCVVSDVSLISNHKINEAYVKPINVYGDLVGSIILIGKIDNMVENIADISSIFLSNYIVS